MILSNDRLRVEIADPGTVYQGPRFDWTGFIPQVTLDNTHTFCVPESLVPGEGTGGIGLCNEFGIFCPIGYDDAKPGEQFPKLGVGLLTKPDAAPHEFFLPYAIEPFPLKIRRATNSIIYEIEPLPCRGYEARLRKTVRLDGAVLDIVYELENVGTRELLTHEYNHNFLAFDGCPPGPDYRLRIPLGVTFTRPSPHLTQNEGEVRWPGNVPNAFLCQSPGPHAKMDGPFWELRHEPTGLGLRASINRPVELFSVWCTPHLIAPEIFVTIDLKPGAHLTWTRRYEFFSPT